MDDIKKGDTVEFKTGGPLMLVTHTYANDKGYLEVWCKWFTTIGECRSEIFKDDWLKKIKKTK